MSDASATAVPDDRSLFRHWRRDVIRFADLDPLGHVNNVAYATYFETGRVGFLSDLGRPVDATALGWMAVRLDIHYRRQLGLPGAVDIGTGVLRVGRTSATLGQALFGNDGCAATSACAMVLVDRGSGRPVAIPDDLRERLAGFGVTENA